MLWARVRVDDDGMRVRGLLWGRRIPRRAVVQVTEYPAVRWRTPRGRVRWTPLHGWSDWWGLREAVDAADLWPTGYDAHRAMTKKARVWQLRLWARC